MIDVKSNFNNVFDSWSTRLDYVEFSDSNTRAILTIPLFHVGPNKKGLYWTEAMLKKIVPLYRNASFRYDLDGVEGSSHTIKKLSSPHFDIGWTYDGEEGAWYDAKSKILWVKGEVTHPQVVEKLQRITSDGKREVNFASMGIIVDEAKCSICGALYTESCENGHERLQTYDMQVCYKVPTECSKGLHVALTNDPADAEAVIAECIFQELGGFAMDKNKDIPSNQNLQSSNGLNNPTVINGKSSNGEETQGPGGHERDGTGPHGLNNRLGSNEQMSPQNEMRQQSSSQLISPNQSQMPGGLVPSSVQTTQPGIAPSPEVILRDLAERIKTLENQVNETQMAEGTPELVNSAPQDQLVQSNMGVTSQFEKKPEESNMDVNDGQNTNAKTPVNPQETQDVLGGDPMSQIMQMLQQILVKLNGGAETQDINELENVKKDKAVHDETKPMDHAPPGDQVAQEASTDEGNKKNKQHMNEPGKVATADDAEDAEDAEDVADDKAEKDTEVADLRKLVDVLAKKVELQTSEVPEFGGTQHNPTAINVADMGAEGRTKAFGEFGAWDAIFKGADSAQRFKR